MVAVVVTSRRDQPPSQQVTVHHTIFLDDLREMKLFSSVESESVVCLNGGMFLICS